MKRILLGLVLGALIAAPLGYGASKLVSNPMTGDLDAGGYSIANVSALSAQTMQSAGGLGIAFGGHLVFNDGAGHLPLIYAGSADPRLGCGDLCNYATASFYLWRHPDGTADAWLKTGPNPGDWTAFALSP